MPIPTVITDLSAVAASNSPSGADSPTQGDDFLRALSAFTRQNYDSIAANDAARAAGDTLIRSDLANAASAALGASLVGNNASLNYAQGTLGFHVNGEPIDPCDAPYNCPTDGTSDCTAAVTSALAVGRGVRLRAGTFRMNLVASVPLALSGAGANKTYVRAFDTSKPAITTTANVSWRFQFVDGIHFLSSTQTGIAFCFGNYTTYSTGLELAGRVHFSRCVFDSFDKGVMKPWGNIGNLFESCTFVQNNYGLWARGAQVGNPSAGMMHCGNDTYLNCEFNDNKKAARLYMDTTAGWGGVVDAGGNIIQFNQGFGSFYDLSLPSFTAYTAIQEQNTWYESNGLSGTVSIDTLSGTQSLTASDRRLVNDSALLNFTQYSRTVGIGTDRQSASINVCTSNRPVMDILHDYAANISRTNLFRAVERSTGTVLASIGFLAQSVSSTVVQIANGTLGLLRVLDTGSFIVGPASPSSTGAHRIGGTAGLGAGSLMLEIVGNGAATSASYFVADSDNSNAAATAQRIGRNFGTGRSINAGGTINASGADYAEYETKRQDCGPLAKGDIVGFDADGLLTDRWERAVTFGVKSTAPSYVGGDNWFSEERPEDESEIAAFEERLEAARQRVDRIAYCGKVPVNVMGASVGDYIIPEATPSGGIGGRAVSSPTLAQYRAALGQVRAVLPDGRAQIVVKVL